MKNKLNWIILLAGVLSLISCEDPVNVPLETEKPRLVVDASINWQKGTSGSTQVIKLSTTTNYYSNVIPGVSGAVVYIKDSNNAVFNFLETSVIGTYQCDDFIPVINETYYLTVISNGQTYAASEILKSVAGITSVTQEMQSGIDSNFLKIKAYFNDPADADNYYLYKYKFSRNLKPEYAVDDDKFFQGNTFFSLVLEEDTSPGQQVEITHYGISKEYYNYMAILLGTVGSSGGPFQSVPATVKGNIKNLTNFENYPLGYFRLSEADVTDYTIQQ